MLQDSLNLAVRADKHSIHASKLCMPARGLVLRSFDTFSDSVAPSASTTLMPDLQYGICRRWRTRHAKKPMLCNPSPVSRLPARAGAPTVQVATVAQLAVQAPATPRPV